METGIATTPSCHFKAIQVVPQISTVSRYKNRFMTKTPTGGHSVRFCGERACSRRAAKRPQNFANHGNFVSAAHSSASKLPHNRQLPDQGISLQRRSEAHLHKLALLSARRLAGQRLRSRMQGVGENRSCPHWKPCKSFKRSTARPMLVLSTAPSSVTVWPQPCGTTTTTPRTTKGQDTTPCPATSPVAPAPFVAASPTAKAHRTNCAS